MVLLQDFTRQKAAEQALAASETSYRMLFNTMLTGFALHEIVLDAQGKPYDYRFLEVNPAFERQTGLMAATVLGKTVREVLPEIEPDWIDRYGAVALTGEPDQFEMVSGMLERTYEVYAFCPRPRQFGVLFTDISNRKQVEVELKEFAEKLQRSNQALEEFAMIASHDMREPLRKVRAFGDLLRTKYGTALDKEGLDYLERMQQAVGRLNSMLDGLLAYSRVETLTRPFHLVNLEHIARDVLADLEVRIAQVSGQVVLVDLPQVEADPVQMRLVFQNLIGNALKFHRAGVAPQVRVSAEPAGGGMLRLVVSDNGIGFSPEEAGKLFQPFHRLVGKYSFEGQGMGLAICRKIIERHGGTISAEGRPEQGATFTITLPYKQK
jgi:PAS domain S-box-containing protein